MPAKINNINFPFQSILKAYAFNLHRFNLSMYSTIILLLQTTQPHPTWQVHLKAVSAALRPTHWFQPTMSMTMTITTKLTSINTPDWPTWTMPQIPPLFIIFTWVSVTWGRWGVRIKICVFLQILKLQWRQAPPFVPVGILEE